MSTWHDLAVAQASRFWGKVDKTEKGCWLWTAGTDKDGYGKFAITAPHGHQPKQKHVRAHRLSWELAHGSIAEELVVMHACDTPRCVNPAHLSVGTQGDNRADCVSKGRGAKGENSGPRRWPASYGKGEDHPCAKLTNEVVRQIRRMYANGKSATDIARSLNLGFHAVYDVTRMRTWRDVA